MVYLSLVECDPVHRREPLVSADVLDAVLEVAESLRQIDLEQVAQQLLDVSAEVGGKANLKQE